MYKRRNYFSYKFWDVMIHILKPGRIFSKPVEQYRWCNGYLTLNSLKKVWRLKSWVWTKKTQPFVAALMCLLFWQVFNVERARHSPKHHDPRSNMPNRKLQNPMERTFHILHLETYWAVMFCTWLIDWFLVFSATFSNISAISWRPVVVVEEAGIPGENHRPWASNW